MRTASPESQQLAGAPWRVTFQLRGTEEAESQRRAPACGQRQAGAGCGGGGGRWPGERRNLLRKPGFADSAAARGAGKGAAGLLWAAPRFRRLGGFLFATGGLSPWILHLCSSDLSSIPLYLVPWAPSVESEPRRVSLWSPAQLLGVFPSPGAPGHGCLFPGWQS